MGVSEDEYFAYPLLHYYDDDNFWSADNTPIYVRYVSNDTGLGYDLQRGGAAFARYVELALAERVCRKLTQSQAIRDDVKRDLKAAKTTALNQDAMNENQPKFKPPGSWTQARWGRSGGRDRGSRGSLIG